MYVHKGGTLYDFCPGKATWDTEAVTLFGLLALSSETGVMLESGGINDQPAWYIDMLAWFMPLYSTAKFLRQASAIFGGGGPTQNANTPGSQPALPAPPTTSGRQ